MSGENVAHLTYGIPMGSAFLACYNRCLAEHRGEIPKPSPPSAGSEDITEAYYAMFPDERPEEPEDDPAPIDPIKQLENHCNDVFNDHKEAPFTLGVQLGSGAKGNGPITCEPFTAMDLFKYNKVQFDKLTETYGLSFYMTYLARWPEYFQKLVNPNGQIVGYIMGKSEGHDENWHGHVTCLSIYDPYRGQGLAGRLMKHLEDISEAKKTYFVDLFVRKSNELAIGMYKKLGYVVYRTVLGYYSGSPEQGFKDEDAYDMRKAMSRDVNKTSIIPLNHPVLPEELD